MMKRKKNKITHIVMTIMLISTLLLQSGNFVFATENNEIPLDSEESISNEKVVENDKAEDTIVDEESKNETENNSQDVKDNVEETIKNPFGIYSAEVDTNELDISSGSIVIDGKGASVGGMAVVNYDTTKPTRIFGSTKENSITVKDVTTKIILDDVSVDFPDTVSAYPMRLSNNANVTLLVKGENKLHSAARNGSEVVALGVDAGSRVEIDSFLESGSQKGSLSAKNTVSNYNSAGIGTAFSAGIGTGDIKISGGSIDTQGGVGIGGMGISTITITGGYVKAKALDSNGAGIGGMDAGCGTILISGGVVDAYSTRAGAGIGVGGRGNGGSITIKGDADVTAEANFEGAGIGLGQSGGNVNIFISENPTVRAIGDRADIGAGGQKSAGANTTINISSGTIITGKKGGRAVSIGNGFTGSSDTGEINITGGNFRGAEGSMADKVIFSKKVSIQNATMDYEKTSDVGIVTQGILNIAGSNIKVGGGIGGNTTTRITSSSLKCDSINATDITFDNTIFEGGKWGIFATNNLSILNHSDMNISSAVQIAVRADKNLVIEASKVKVENASPANQATVTLWGDTSITIKNSEIVTSLPNSIDRNAVGLYGQDIKTENSKIRGKGFIYAKSGGTFNSTKDYINLTNAADGIYCGQNGTFNINESYLDLKKGIRMAKTNGTLNPGTLNVRGNSVLFISEHEVPTVNFEKGILFYNENSEESKQYHGKVVGDVELTNSIDNEGTVLSIPPLYTLMISAAAQSNTILIPENKKLTNNGTIINESDISVGGELNNSKKGKIYNMNVTPMGISPKGGEINLFSKTSIVNDGEIFNELYIEEITKDGEIWDEKDALLSIPNQNMTDYEIDQTKKMIKVKQGTYDIYYNSYLGTTVVSDLGYKNQKLSYFTLYYDHNYDQITSFKIVALGAVKDALIPKRSGYAFFGWYQDKECKDIWNMKSDMIDKPTTLYAKWNKEEVPIVPEVPTNPDTTSKPSNPSITTMPKVDDNTVTESVEEKETSKKPIEKTEEKNQSEKREYNCNHWPLIIVLITVVLLGSLWINKERKKANERESD